MKILFALRCLIFYVLVYFVVSVDSDGAFVDVVMPGFSPTEDEQYICVSAEITTPGYVVEFLPSATADRTHHMLAFGCNGPYKPPGETWKCEVAPMCSSPRIIYAWARNAPPLVLPENVGVPIGKGEGMGYVVLQMHYAKKFGGKVSDYSGVRLRITEREPQYLAGIYLFLPFSGSGIPPNTQNFFMNASCEFTYDTEVHPFAFRPHTHHLGRIVSSYKYSKDGKWAKIGKGNPQWPQRFYPIENAVTIHKGDVLAAQCVYDSTGSDHGTSLGSHGHNEMCNFYMYYYVDNKHRDILHQFQSCSLNERTDLFQQYPPEASVRFPPMPEMDEIGKQGEMSFGVLDVPSWPNAAIVFGQIAGLAVDKDENLVVFHRGDHVWGENTFNESDHYMETDKGPISDNAVVVLSEDGNVVSKWGRSFFYMPHGIFMDEHGFIWLTDVAMHQVFKFDMKQQNVKPLLALGKVFEPGSDQEHFCKPSAVAVPAGEGTVFVADGYCNNRIMTFSVDGRFIRSWGEASSDNRRVIAGQPPPSGTFNLPHDLSLDNARRRIFVADRENGRFQVFTFDGTPLAQVAIKDFGDTVYGIHYCPEFDTVFVVNGPSITHSVDFRVFAFDGSTLRVLYSWEPVYGILQKPHAVLSSKDCSRVFVGEVGPNNLWRFDIQSTGRRAISDGNKAMVDKNVVPGEVHNGHGQNVTKEEAHKEMTDNGESIQDEVHDTFKLMVIIFLVIATPAAVIIAVCCCMNCRKKGNFGRNLREGGLGHLRKKGLFSNGHNRDLKGFQPLSTEDIDASEDSDDSDTLYMAQKNFVSRKA